MLLNTKELLISDLIETWTRPVCEAAPRRATPSDIVLLWTSSSHDVTWCHIVLFIITVRRRYFTVTVYISAVTVTHI